MAKRLSEQVYYGQLQCQATKKDCAQCENRAYYVQEHRYLCGVHSDKKKRQELPPDREAKQRRLDERRAHAAALDRLEAAQPGQVQCYGMRRMKPVPLREGWLNVFPNNKHQNRGDGFGCCSLSPMQLGPVQHRQPGLPEALNIENYHQYNKVWPNEVGADQNPLDAFYETQRAAYRDPVPHRHKYDPATMKELRAQVHGQNRNAPLYSLHQTLDGAWRRFSYVESRYFYCKAYESLAKQSADFTALQLKLQRGVNLCICGYDAREVDEPLDTMYADPRHPFGHELVLYSLLTLADARDYPWNRYRVEHPRVYDNVAHVESQ